MSSSSDDGNQIDPKSVRFEAIFNSQPECVKILDDSGRILRINPAGIAILGAKSTSEVLGLSIYDLVVPEYRERIHCCFLHALETEGSYCEIQIRTLRGEHLWMETHMITLRDITQRREVMAVTRDVTRAKSAEAALRESQERFQQLADNIQDVFWMMDAKRKKLLYISPAYERIWGRSCSSLYEDPLSWTYAVIPEDSALVQEALRQREVTGTSDIEYRIRQPDGTVRWIHDRCFPIFDDSGETYRLAGLASDITRRCDRELEISKLSRLHRFSSRLNDAILHQTGALELFLEACQIAVDDHFLEMAWVGVLDERLRVLKPVVSAGRVEGYLDNFSLSIDKSDEAFGPAATAFRTGTASVLDDIANDPHFVTKAAALSRNFRSCAAFPILVSGKSKAVLVLYSDQLHFFRAEETALLQRLADNLGFAIEIADRDLQRKKAESALAESEERFRLIVENSTDLIAELTSEGKILYVSPAFQPVLGHVPADLLGRSLADFVHPEDAAELLKMIGPPDGSVVFRFRHHDGTWRYVESTGRPFTTSSGEERAVVISRDITERREMEAAKMVAENQLRQAQKMEALGTLAGGIAHDFNNILGSIIGNVELARMDLDPAHPATENLGYVLKAANRATDLVRQILLFSRRKDQERKLVHVPDVLNEVMSLLRPALPSTIEIRTRVSPSVPKVFADPSQIFQVLMNLATNAFHAMRKHGGVLEISLSDENIANDFRRTRFELPAGDYLKITVADTGDGIAPDILDRIFEPFFTTKPVGEGTGLGLSVVHGIVTANDGIVLVDSTVSVGTRFEVYLPAAISPGIAEANQQAQPIGNGESVLFVDDEPNIRRVGELLLRRCGYNPVVFESASDALEELKRNPTAYSAVITDLTMPKVSGLVFAREVKKVSAELPVILTTGFAGDLTKDDPSRYGVDELLPKPFSVETLLQALQRNIAKKSSI